jgi:DNA-binding NarL/FixJ family response regulator
VVIFLEHSRVTHFTHSSRITRFHGCRAAGAAAYLLKPIQKTELIAVIKAATEGAILQTVARTSQRPNQTATSSPEWVRLLRQGTPT